MYKLEYKFSHYSQHRLGKSLRHLTLPENWKKFRVKIHRSFDEFASMMSDCQQNTLEKFSVLACNSRNTTLGIRELYRSLLANWRQVLRTRAVDYKSFTHSA